MVTKEMEMSESDEFEVYLMSRTVFDSVSGYILEVAVAWGGKEGRVLLERIVASYVEALHTLTFAAQSMNTVRDQVRNHRYQRTAFGILLVTCDKTITSLLALQSLVAVMELCHTVYAVAVLGLDSQNDKTMSSSREKTNTLRNDYLAVIREMDEYLQEAASGILASSLGDQRDSGISELTIAELELLAEALSGDGEQLAALINAGYSGEEDGHKHIVQSIDQRLKGAANCLLLLPELRYLADCLATAFGEVLDCDSIAEALRALCSQAATEQISQWEDEGGTSSIHF